MAIRPFDSVQTGLTAGDVEAAAAAAIAAANLPTIGDVETAVTNALGDAIGAKSHASLDLAPSGDTEAWLVAPSGSTVVRVFEVLASQSSTGSIQLLRGTALNDAGSVALTASWQGMGPFHVGPSEKEPLWTLGAGEGLILKRGNMTSTQGADVWYTQS